MMLVAVARSLEQEKRLGTVVRSFVKFIKVSLIRLLVFLTFVVAGQSLYHYDPRYSESANHWVSNSDHWSPDTL